MFHPAPPDFSQHKVVARFWRFSVIITRRSPVLDSYHEMEEMDFDFTQENEVFGNFNGFVTEEEVEEGGSSIEEAAM
ncbi:hypothetical protein AYX13_06368 [Cryptococcus neoformans]|nr:hypothetical protein AYX13_06368 [Cryptococcus neoformans var. grubii]